MQKSSEAEISAQEAIKEVQTSYFIQIFNFGIFFKKIKTTY